MPFRSDLNLGDAKLPEINTGTWIPERWVVSPWPWIVATNLGIETEVKASFGKVGAVGDQDAQQRRIEPGRIGTEQAVGNREGQQQFREIGAWFFRRILSQPKGDPRGKTL